MKEPPLGELGVERGCEKGDEDRWSKPGPGPEGLWGGAKLRLPRLPKDEPPPARAQALASWSARWPMRSKAAKRTTRKNRDHWFMLNRSLKVNENPT
jgi:hypothetical protein